MMDVGFAAGTRQRNQLHVHYVEIVAQPRCPFPRIEPCLELRHLGSNAHGALARVAVVAIARGGGETFVVGADVPVRTTIDSSLQTAADTAIKRLLTI